MTLLAAMKFFGTGLPAAAASVGPGDPVPQAAAEEKSHCPPRGLLDLLKGGCPEAPETTGSIAPAEPAPRSGPDAGESGLRALIHKHAAIHGLPPTLAEAVVHVESRFDPRATGAAGEIGLMQIKPSTARGLGYRGSVRGLYDVETNLTWGMRYLAEAYDLAGGSTCGTILRYNAGHAARRMTGRARAYCAKVNRYVATP